MCVSLIWTKLKLPGLASAAAAGEITRDDSTPPVETQTSPVPAQAMHSRNPRRSIWSMSASLYMVAMNGREHRRELLHGHDGLHVGVQRAKVLVAAGTGERLRERVLMAEASRTEGAVR